MAIILFSLIVGILIGWFGFLPKKWLGSLNRINTVLLFFMLFTLGAQIGGNGELLSHLSQLGGRAFAISLLSVLGSVGALWLTMRIKHQGDES